MVELLIRLVINAALLLFVSRLGLGVHWRHSLGSGQFFRKTCHGDPDFPFHNIDAGFVPPGYQRSHAMVGVRARSRNPFTGLRVSYSRESAFLIESRRERG